MREHGIVGLGRPGKIRRVTGRHRAPAPGLLRGDFTAQAPNTRRVASLTEFQTQEDKASPRRDPRSLRGPRGRLGDQQARTAEVAGGALAMASKQRRPAGGVIHHATTAASTPRSPSAMPPTTRTTVSASPRPARAPTTPRRKRSWFNPQTRAPTHPRPPRLPHPGRAQSNAVRLPRDLLQPRTPPSPPRPPHPRRVRGRQTGSMNNQSTVSTIKGQVPSCAVHERLSPLSCTPPPGRRGLYARDRRRRAAHGAAPCGPQGTSRRRCGFETVSGWKGDSTSRPASGGPGARREGA